MRSLLDQARLEAAAAVQRANARVDAAEANTVQAMHQVGVAARHQTVAARNLSVRAGRGCDVPSRG